LVVIAVAQQQVTGGTEGGRRRVWLSHVVHRDSNDPVAVGRGDGAGDGAAGGAATPSSGVRGSVPDVPPGDTTKPARGARSGDPSPGGAASFDAQPGDAPAGDVLAGDGDPS